MISFFYTEDTIREINLIADSIDIHYHSSVAGKIKLEVDILNYRKMSAKIGDCNFMMGVKGYSLNSNSRNEEIKKFINTCGYFFRNMFVSGGVDDIEITARIPHGYIKYRKSGNQLFEVASEIEIPQNNQNFFEINHLF